ncbi:MAG: hypothetical protein Fur0037_09470 [Planctomycetota bacterium]
MRSVTPRQRLLSDSLDPGRRFSARTPGPIRPSVPSTRYRPEGTAPAGEDTPQVSHKTFQIRSSFEDLGAGILLLLFVATAIFA